MGSLLSRNKKEGTGRRLFPFWSNGVEPQKSPTNQAYNTSPKKVPDDNATSIKPEWTDVSLKVPDSTLPANIENELITNIPVPPPRKHRGKSHSIRAVIEESKVKKSAPIQNATEIPTKPLMAIEEPIIVPKKVPIHICDGTHHHVTNIANGKVIHNTHIGPKSTHEMKNAKIYEHRKEKLGRPQNLSTTSLPNYGDLSDSKPKERENYPVNLKKKPKRHISVVSLPTESKVALSATTAARLENYIMRCKSFGSLPPRDLLEKLHLEYSSDSEDSWDGVDDWDLEIMEHTRVNISPVVPRSRLSANQTNPLHGIHTESRLPTTIEEAENTKEDVRKALPLPQGVITLKKTEGRRESIDDFFDSKAQNPIKKFAKHLSETSNENYLGRRGSDGIFGYDKRCYPFKNPDKDSTFKSDTFFSSSLLDSEAAHAQKDLLAQRRKSAGAALHRIDSKDYEDDSEVIKVMPVTRNLNDESDLKDTFESYFNKSQNEKKNSHEIEKTDTESITEEVKKVPRKGKPTELPANEDNVFTNDSTKPIIVEHSNLLKFLQGNLSTEDDILFKDEKSVPTVTDQENSINSINKECVKNEDDEKILKKVQIAEVKTSDDKKKEIMNSQLI